MEAVSRDQVTPDRVADIFMAHTNARGMMPMVLDMEESRGVKLVDSASGRTYLDLFGFYASSAIGMNHPKMESDKDFLERLHLAALNKITNSDIRTTLMARFLDTFARVGIPEHLPHSFYVAGGALAVENALKAAFDWKVRKNFRKGYRREVGHQVMHFDQAFHGRSGYTLSLTNTSDPRKTMYFPKFDWPRVSNPKMVFPVEDHLADIEEREQVALNQAKHFFHARKDDIAAVIIEPIQGEGGDNHFRREFLQALKDLCLENECLLVFDEVQTGVGATGEFWAHEAIGVEPDIISFGKKTQVCGILAGRRIEEVDENVFTVGSRINSTWGGNLVDMVRFDRVLEIIEEDDLLAHTRDTGAYLMDQLHSMQTDLDSVSNVRGRGLFCALDLPSREFRDRLLQRAYDEGVIILGCGVKSVRFRTPLTVTREELDMGVEVLRHGIQTIEKEYSPYRGQSSLREALTSDG
ncbi:MAG: L-lysine 6-transaminase [Rhodothermales bacterium]|nr:L-lysine 6-transaminase [Rhodothermales bacterium]MBO6780403.1 L-lysine 6-transaminase [Rhodothermales bacterium]